MATITLDEIREATEAKYGSTDIPVSDSMNARLLNPLRLSKANREALSKVQDDATKEAKAAEEAEEAGEEVEESSDEEEYLNSILSLVCETEGQWRALDEWIGDDLATRATVLELYMKGQQVGEAEPSQS